MSLPCCDDTIVAVASAPGPGARGIVRLSGPHAVRLAQELCKSCQPVSEPGNLQSSCSAGQVRLTNWPGPLPALLYRWPTQTSYTGQPCAEVHTVASPVLLQSIVESICSQGARPAGPGEFTQRAFLNGKLDLTQAEAVLEIIHAENRHQLDAALTQLAGGIARPLTQLRSCLLDLLADLEAGLDFVEEDISFLAPNELAAQLATARETVQEAMRQLAQRQTASYRPRVVLAGWPNVGKSSLFNWLTGGNAIVSPLPGTTRDYLHGIWQFETQPKWSVDLVDTAGFEPITSNALSTSATLASRSERLTADLEIFCLDASREINHWECQELQFNPPQPRLIVWTKADLAPQSPARPGDQIAVSSHSGTGLAELSAAASKLLREATATRPTALYSGAIRSSASLQAAANALAEASRFQDAGAGEELVAAEVRHALESIGLAVGAVYTDDLLDRIFSRFCIGK